VWALAVELNADGLAARTTIHLGPDGVEARLDDFFAGLAADWRGWEGMRAWEGMEGGLELRCVHDGIAHAQVEVTLHHLSGADWIAKATVPVDLGQLETVARRLRQLLTVG
jgi:hypothetical protein